MAYSAVKTERTKNSGCGNVVSLYVADHKNTDHRSAHFHRVFVHEPSSGGGDLNSIRPVAWSPGGRWLVAAYDVAWHGSDAGGQEVLVYDAKSKRVFKPDLSVLLRRAQGRECSFQLVEVLGFKDRSRVRLRLADWYDVGEDAPLTHCFAQKEEWLLDLEQETIQRAAQFAR